MSATQALDVTPAQPTKALGDDLESALIQCHDELEGVPDDDCEWHDATTTTLWTPTARLPFGGICLVEVNTPVEVKAAREWTSNGRNAVTRGRWFIKRESHQRRLKTHGVYYLTVYDDDRDNDECHVLGQLVIPASLLDEHLKGRWYDSNRREGDVAKLAWNHLIPTSHLGG